MFISAIFNEHELYELHTESFQIAQKIRLYEAVVTSEELEIDP